MPIKLKVSEAIEVFQAINRLPKMPAKPSYRLARVSDKLQPIVKAFETQRNAVIEEHGEKDAKGQTSVKDPEKLKVVEDELKKLLDVEEEIALDPVRLDEVLGSDPAREPQIEPALLSALEKVIVE